MMSAALVATACCLAAAVVAAAALPVKSGTYRGKAEGYAVSFKVSANGQRVTKLKLPLPASCQYGGIAPLKLATAKVSKQGTFTTTLTFFALNGMKEGTVTVSGTFRAKGKEAGAITSRWRPGPPGVPPCSATWRYSTSA